MQKTLLSLAVAGAVALPSIGIAAVVNGGFEMDPGTKGLVHGNTFASMASAPAGNGSWDVWTNLPDATGWMTTSGSGIELQTKNTVGLTPHSGDYYAELDSQKNKANGEMTNSTMAQDVTLAAGRHALSFWYSPRTNSADDNGIEFSLGSLVSGIADGPGVGPPPTAVGMWTEYVSIFDVAIAGTYTLSFSAVGNQNTFGGYLDDVAINAAPVPLPASLLLFAGGLGGLGFMGKRRKG